MLVLFYFYDLGYSAFTARLAFLFYEIFGIVTNLVGGWLGGPVRPALDALHGPRDPGLCAAMLGLVPALPGSSIPYVMTAQALSGIAKDLTKMSSKSAVKLVVPEGTKRRSYRWVAILTGSKNALKGVGFFVGGAAADAGRLPDRDGDPGRRWS